MTKSISGVFTGEEKVNIGYIVAGYPNLSSTEEFLRKLDQSTLDMLEIGIPYPDPLTDGKLITEASFAALQTGVTTGVVFDLLEKVKGEVHESLFFLVHYNLLFAYGVEAFVQRCTEVGISGLIIPDLPYEEATAILSALKTHNIVFIPLVSVTSGARITQIVRLGEGGFIYAAGSLGVTGSKQASLDCLQHFIDEIRQHTSSPIALGFGIKTHSDVETMRHYADGVIVGTSIVAYTQNNSVDSVISEIGKIFG